MCSMGYSFNIGAIANIIACNLSDEELGLTAAIFTQLGDTLDTIQACRALKNKCDNDT